MKRFSLFFFLLFFFCLFHTGAAGAQPFRKDIYPDFETLKKNHVYGRDYRISVTDRKSPVTVLAIHGGRIEWGTSEVARELAGEDWNLYLFEGLMKNSRSLHITSPHFNEPSAVALSASSVLTVAVHRQYQEGDIICVGGGNAAVSKSVADSLAEYGFSVEQPCKRLPGDGPSYIGNRAKNGGVQLELSNDIGRTILTDKAKLSRFCSAVRSAVKTHFSQASAAQ